MLFALFPVFWLTRLIGNEALKKIYNANSFLEFVVQKYVTPGIPKSSGKAYLRSSNSSPLLKANSTTNKTPILMKAIVNWCENSQVDEIYMFSYLTNKQV